MRQNQEERNRLDSEVGHLTRKVHELQSQLNAVQAKAQSTDHENEEDDDLLDVSLAVAATGELIHTLLLHVLILCLVSYVEQNLTFLSSWRIWS